jgi:formylglycine-generating enzyme required for sulfatase activity
MRKIANQTIPEDQVKLRPVMGIKPGTYLAVIYSLALAIILFFVLLFPGLSRPGALVVFNSEPQGAALRADGLYMGTSPCKVFVPSGRRQLEALLPGFTHEQVERDIPGRVFASALFPKRYLLDIALTAPDAKLVLAEGAADYAAWGAGGEPTASWQVPLSLSDAAYQIGAQVEKAEADELLAAAARFASTRAALRDLARAKTLSDNAGLIPSPLSLLRSASDIIGFLSQAPGAGLWLAEQLPADSASIVAASSWHGKQKAALAETAAGESLAASPSGAGQPASYPPRSFSLGGLAFTGIPSGVLVQDFPLSRSSVKTQVPVPGFLICNTPVSVDAFYSFVLANPEWSSDNREILTARGLANASYLFDDRPAALSFSGASRFARSELSAESQVAISWHAAQAYCRWLSSRLPLSMKDYEVRLPSEAEWEYAAKSARGWNFPGIFPGANAPAMAGGLWEWCADPYAPLAFIPAASGAINAVGSPERSLRGWINPADQAGPAVRASLPPDACSSFVSFRPVIALREK